MKYFYGLREKCKGFFPFKKLKIWKDMCLNKLLCLHYYLLNTTMSAGKKLSVITYS